MSLIEQLQRGVDTNEPPDKTDRIMTDAADEIDRLRAVIEEIMRTTQDGHAHEMCRKALANE